MGFQRTWSMKTLLATEAALLPGILPSRKLSKKCDVLPCTKKPREERRARRKKDLVKRRTAKPSTACYRTLQTCKGLLNLQPCALAR